MHNFKIELSMSTRGEKLREKKADTAVIPHLERHSQ